MAGEWLDLTLGDVLTLQRGFDLPETERRPGSVPVIASTGQVGTHTEAMVKGPGVLIGRSGSLGGGQFIRGDFWPLNTTLWVNVGSGVPTLNRNHIHPLPVRVPSEVSEQHAIAHILGTLDDKIELNRRMNETLESMARAEFRRMKEECGDSCTLGELAAIQGGKQLPTEECRPSGSYPVFGANGIMGYAERVTQDGFVIAFGRVGAYCGSIHWAYCGAWIKNNASSVVPHRWPEFVLQAMLDIDFHAMRTGSAQPFIPNSSLASAEIERPSDKGLDDYCAFARPLRLKQDILGRESRTLAAIRDALLPKLLSGEIRVKNTERIIAEV